MVTPTRQYLTDWRAQREAGTQQGQALGSERRLAASSSDMASQGYLLDR